jgi:hypothetical protein
MLPSDVPSERALQVVRILAVPRAEGLCVLFCGPYQGLLTHYLQGRSWGCPGPEKCPTNVHRARTLWKGYAPVRAWNATQDHWFPGVLEITEALEETLRGRRLAGEVWMLHRENDRKKSGPIAGVLLETRPPSPLSAPFDIRPPLCRMYHSLDLELGVPNPLPAKVTAPIALGERPPLPAAPQAAEVSPPTPQQLQKLRRLAGMPGAAKTGSNGKG